MQHLEDMIVDLFDNTGKIRAEILNWDIECVNSMTNGTGFVITDPPYENVSMKDDNGNKRKQKRMKGIYSPLYGTEWGDDDAIEDHFRCKCGNLKGKVYETQVCPQCNTEVEYLDVDMNKTGWIILTKHHIIQPLMYNMLQSIMDGARKKYALGNLHNTIHPPYKLTEDGHPYVEPPKDDSNPFYGIGIPEFKERFEEIMEYYRAKYPAKSPLIDEILKNKDAVFVRSIPVYSYFLRPEAPGFDRNYIHKANKLYGPMVSKVRLLNKKGVGYGKFKEDTEKMVEAQTIETLHDKLLELWDDTFNRIEGKFGHIRGDIISGRMNYTFRTVIVPNSSLKADEIIVSYRVFLETYRYEIISLLVKMTGATYSQANHEWNVACVSYSKRIYQIMLHILDKLKPYVALNRPPTINIGSLMPVRIVGVREGLNDNDATEISTLVLTPYNADFDGDQLQKTSLKTNDITQAFIKTMSPRERMYISSNDGLYNSEFGLIKDQAIGLWAFNNY